jgi:hypothetical protein
MNTNRTAERVRQEIIRLCHAGLDSRTFRIESVKRLKKAIPVDASFFATADPEDCLTCVTPLDEPPGDLPHLRPGRIDLDTRFQPSVGDHSRQTVETI